MIELITLAIVLGMIRLLHRLVRAAPQPPSRVEVHVFHHFPGGDGGVTQPKEVLFEQNLSSAAGNVVPLRGRGRPIPATAL